MRRTFRHPTQIAVLALLLALAACAPGGKNSLPDSADNEHPLPQAPAEGGPAAPPTIPPPSPSAQQVPLGANPYVAPWKDPRTAIVIDAYQGNSIDWDAMATDARVAGVLHRSSIGLQVDTKYKSRREIARQRGYLWGAYHLGRAGDPIQQAKFFLKTIGDDPEALIALDLEDTSSSSMMNIDDSVRFMDYVYRATGRIPVVYANHSVTKALNRALAANALFPKSKLWYARFRSDIPDFPKGIWKSYFLWQFSSEINCNKTGTCLYNVPGTRYDMDINVFYGTREQLAAVWSE